MKKSILNQEWERKVRQPYYHKKRFYNHEHDTIKDRIWGAARYFGRKLVKKALFLEKPFLPNKNDLDEWTITQPFIERSISPVITWIGHATFLIQMNGITILTDPVYSDISRFFKRHSYPATTIEELPPIDLVVISHNHRDHCDAQTLKHLARLHNPTLLVPQGDKKLGEKLGFKKVHELSWWQEVIVDNHYGLVRCTFLPAHHWTGRGLFDINRSLWGSWMIQANTDTLYFAGDTAYSDHFKEIQQQFECIDVALMPIGPAEPRHLMKDAHIDHEEAVQAFIDLKARYFIPMHWGTFHSGIDSFLEPISKLQNCWSLQKHQLLDGNLCLLKFGERWIYPTYQSRCAEKFNSKGL